MSLLIVSNRLPLIARKVKGKLEFHPGEGGLATSMADFSKKRGSLWVGWPGIVDEDLEPGDKKLITKELAKHNCRPVFLNREQFEGFYNGYSNSVLWPHLHDLEMPESIPSSWWTIYKEVNELFAKTVARYQNTKSDIWIHDYQLLLLPQLVRKRAPEASIGFFLHITFPEAANFIKLKESTSLVKGMLGADLIGMHTTSYSKNFMDSAKALDLGTPSAGQVILADRSIRVADFPIGIDYDKFARAKKSRAVKRHMRRLRRKYSRYKTILTVDRLDPTKAFPERLRAYHTLLDRNPDLRGKVVMIMIAVPSRTEIDVYKRLKEEVDGLVAKTNSAFGTKHWKPIHFRYTSIPFEELSALYQLADVAFVAPLRDGMNLVAKEFIASKTGGKGVLILSQNAGAAEELAQAVLVNPKRQRSLVQALTDGLLMPQDELQERLEAMQETVAGNGVQHWAGSFMASLGQSVVGRKSHAHPITRKAESEIEASYHQASRRLLMLDYDGVLMPFYDHPWEAKPNKKLITILKKLSGVSSNDIVIVSGRKQKDLQDWLGDLPITLASEHSATIRPKGKDWETISSPDIEWKKMIKPLLEKFANLTPGALVEEKDFSLVWHYRAASPYYTQKNMVVLRPALQTLAKAYGLGVHNGNKIIEIKPKALNKGVIARKSIKPQHDFMLAIGDDYTDEQIFKSLPANTFTIKVGSGKTAARYRMRDVKRVLKLLSRLVD